ncbi:GNAT family N-acetyltransferase [Spirosoma utsteinense]|uniref:GNAT superfamily N-acetyltransferase n=1 Tax=Spirosoma utsteinense TaxID=2585773 RepID=A0ABR6W4C9_9BACT|nr:GNAT family N-acetyltransferase [Spirosoma utsteinense]MBC3787051.1 GNAT superfamily N-acetyltransferase [Spirosoma utsteinense]MBC3791400.1 GNAT superfamily N-acetyltransferase [Spirosoma utsteinense]
MTPTLISPASQADIPALNDLVNSAYRGDSSRRGWTTEADLLDGIRTDETGLAAMLANPQATILKYEQDGQLIGCVYLEKKGDRLYLGMLTVSPDAQAGGIGKQLMTAAEQLARDWQCRAMKMTVIPQRHELIAFYERRGYQPTGETEPFPMDDTRFGLPKQPLSFIVMEKVLETA